MNKHWVGETVVFNWLFYWPFNSCQFGDIESRARNWNHMGVFCQLILKQTDLIHSVT